MARDLVDSSLAVRSQVDLRLPLAVLEDVFDLLENPFLIDSQSECVGSSEGIHLLLDLPQPTQDVLRALIPVASRRCQGLAFLEAHERYADCPCGRA